MPGEDWYPQNLYVVQRNPEDPEKWDVVRNAPTVISVALRKVEADALAFSLNVQINTLEGRNAK